MSGDPFFACHHFFFLMKTQPPDIPDHKLFRSLLVTPRPRRLLEFKIAGIKLYAQAVSSAELADFESKDSQYAGDVMSASVVLSDNSRAFGSGQSMMNTLTVAEFKELSEQVYQALSEISPLLTSCDYKAWTAKLESGAKHASNIIQAQALGSSLSFTVLPDKLITHDHPERWFNIPQKELLDCHWLAYWAARSVYKNKLFVPENNEAEFVNAAKDTVTTALKDLRGRK